jgi:hypothetical protein
VKVPRTIRLHEHELRLARWVGRKRYDANTGTTVDRKVGGGSALFIDENGTCGEFAAAKLFNVFPDLTLYNRADSHAGDMLVGSYTVDIKTTHYATGILVITLDKLLEKCPDAFALMTGDFRKGPEYTYHGGIDARRVFEDQFLGDLGHGPSRVVERKHLIGNPGLWLTHKP